MPIKIPKYGLESAGEEEKMDEEVENSTKFIVSDSQEYTKRDPQQKKIFPYQNGEFLSLAIYHLESTRTWIFIGKGDSTIAVVDVETYERV